MRKDFKTILKDQFNYLITDFDFKLGSFNKIDGGFCADFLNNSCGVRIKYEFREAYVYITLHKIFHGRLAENIKPIIDESCLNAVALDDVIFLKNPEAIIKAAFAYGADSEFYDKERGLELYVARFADNLRNYAADVLNGNFEIFSSIYPIIKKRLNYDRIIT